MTNGTNLKKHTGRNTSMVNLARMFHESAGGGPWTNFFLGRPKGDFFQSRSRKRSALYGIEVAPD
jgi:hypothetical protein